MHTELYYLNKIGFDVQIYHRCYTMLSSNSRYPSNATPSTTFTSSFSSLTVTTDLCQCRTLQTLDLGFRHFWAAMLQDGRFRLHLGLVHWGRGRGWHQRRTGHPPRRMDVSLWTNVGRQLREPKTWRRRRVWLLAGDGRPTWVAARQSELSC